MDVNKNDVDGLYIGEYPTLMFYSKENKTGEVYTQEKSLKKMKEFVLNKTAEASTGTKE
jgi:hypothetical protein